MVVYIHCLIISESSQITWNVFDTDRSLHLKSVQDISVYSPINISFKISNKSVNIFW